MSWNWLKDGVGGGIDFLTGGFTDFDQKGNDIRWGQTGSPIFGGSDGKWGPEPEPFSFGDAMDAFTKGYSATMSPGGANTTGKSWLDNSYLAGRGATPTTSSPVSTSSVFAADGGTHTLGDSFLIKEKPDFYAFKDNVQYPSAMTGGGGGGSKSSGGSKIGNAISGAVSGFAACGGNPICAIGGGISGLLCDMRFKTDIALLETTEVNDELAQAAFFVKKLRECS